MSVRYYSLPQTTVKINAAISKGNYEWWRHTLGHGGINSHPLPVQVIKGIAKLKPRLIRIFIQEFFNIYPDHGQFDWSRLDPYMESLAATGAKIVASLTIKPNVLFPVIDHQNIKPNNIEEWQNVVRKLVKRYSIDNPIVTHWEIGNEGDLGDGGGSPYYFETSESYYEYYHNTVDAILSVFPQAKVGGPAFANPDHPTMSGLLRYCMRHNLQLDFISWHIYNHNPRSHSDTVNRIREKIWETGIAPQPEMFVTEYSTSFEPVSIEELAYSPERAAMVAGAIIAMMDVGLDYSFYYHIWDQTHYREEFDSFFRDSTGMTRHWNEVPHRFGLFGVNTEVRPQYYVFQMFSRMGEERIYSVCESNEVRLHAARQDQTISTMIVNYEPHANVDRIINLNFHHVAPGRKMLRVYRVDDKHSWSNEQLELIPIEQREIDSPEQYHCQIYSPANSVAMVTLTSIC